jgi:YYY domain-containing protein
VNERPDQTDTEPIVPSSPEDEAIAPPQAPGPVGLESGLPESQPVAPEPAPAEEASLIPGDAPTAAATPITSDEPTSAAQTPSAPGRGRRRWGWAVTGALLVAILAAGAYFRFLGVDWDQGQHLHPDERFLTMVASNFQLPPDFTGYMDSQTSTMNPRNTGHEFFVYGAWPITLAYLVAEPFGLTGYDQIYLVGRKLSALWDLLALLLLFVLGTRLADRRVGLLAAALGAVAAFSIQLAHFFTVESATNLFVMIFLVGLVEAARHRRDGFLVLSGVGLGMALASKISVWPLVVVALVALALSERERMRHEVRRGWWRFGVNVAVLGVVSFLTLRIADPTMFVGPGWPNVVENPELYAKVTGAMGCEGADPQAWCRLRAVLPDALEPFFLPDPRWMENMHRVQDMVTGFGMDWPPNHQWWGRWPWLFPLKNIVLWGLGLPLGVLAVLAWGIVALAVARRNTRLLIPWLWATLLFLYLGSGWAKTMRYFYPIYPAMIVLAAWTMVALYDWSRAAAPARRRLEGAFRRPVLALGLIAVVLGGTALWGFMFSRIYARDHSRVAASYWIYHHIPTAMNLTVPAGAAPGPYLPATHSTSLTFSGFEWTLPAGQASEPARVLVPGSKDVPVDGAMLARVVDPGGAGGQRTVKAWLTNKPARDASGQPDGILAQGETTVQLSGTKPQDIRVPFEPLVLKAQSTGVRSDYPAGTSLGERLLGPPPPEGTQASEYYVWFEVDAPVAGKLPVIAYETNWDDIIPLGMLGYAAFDNADTPYGEGFYGSANLDLYAEDDETKANRLVDELEKTDYIAISSNRVYGSTIQLPTRYPLTNEYYRRLFAGELGFKQVLDGHSYPNLGPWEVNDQPAEEAWHVYDHPKTQVFEKTADFDPARLRADLAPLSAERTWVFPPRPTGLFAGLKASLIAITAGTKAYTGSVAPAEPAESGVKPLSSVMLSEARRLRQRADGTWSRLFNPDGIINRYPALAVLWWYLILGLVGLAAWPVVARALPSLADRGWAVSRVAGLLVVSWLAWIVASYELARHTPLLVWVALGVVGAAGAWMVWRHHGDLAAFLRAHWRLILVEELLFAGLFLVFLGIRMGNPDLWHPYFGGEKPMDFAYLNATLRTVSFPPYDPWFAGGKLNYYYYGFVFIGALIQLTGIVPWVAYNLAIPTLAAMSGLAVFGIAYTWSRRIGRRPVEAALAGGLGMVLAVIGGNLYQVKFILDKLGEVAPGTMESQIPGLATALNAVRGWAAVMSHQASLDMVPTHHWYWNASRAIPGDPITEFPFFTFLYADLHAHMMAMPIAMLAFTIALSWVILTPEERLWATPVRRWQLLRLGLAALAIGALWPTNTWDFPTYGLVTAGAIAVAQWQRHGRFGWGWVASVLYRGVPLLLLALLFFRPYHAGYVQPYSSFDPYRGARTDLAPYLTVHGIFLYAILSWAVVAFWRAWGRAAERRRMFAAALLTVATFGGAVGYLWFTQAARIGAGSPDLPAPSPWVPVLATVMLAVGVPLLVLRRSTAPERFMAFLFVLGVLLTQFVEYVVLRGDIGRMNTVFKFYIQVWLIWAVLAAVCVAWLVPYIRGFVWSPRRVGTVAPVALEAPAVGESAPAGSESGLMAGEPVLAAGDLAEAAPELGDTEPAAVPGAPAGRQASPWVGTVWATVMGVLVVFGLVYPVTAARAKITDRFPAMGPMTSEERQAYDARVRPSLSGWDYLDYAKYDDDSQILTLRYDRDAFDWILRNIPGTPTILEGYRVKAYRWGSRYSINTGLPTVIGWDWHQKQQRNAVGGQVVDERTADVAEVYNTTDVRRAQEILDKYAVDYIIVGEMERDFYDAAGLAKFEQMAKDGQLQQVYPTAGMPETPVRIWRRVTPAAAR